MIPVSIVSNRKLNFKACNGELVVPFLSHPGNKNSKMETKLPKLMGRSRSNSSRSSIAGKTTTPKSQAKANVSGGSQALRRRSRGSATERLPYSGYETLKVWNHQREVENSRKQREIENSRQQRNLVNLNKLLKKWVLKCCLSKLRDIHSFFSQQRRRYIQSLGNEDPSFWDG